MQNKSSGQKFNKNISYPLHDRDHKEIICNRRKVKELGLTKIFSINSKNLRNSSRICEIVKENVTFFKKRGRKNRYVQYAEFADI